MGNPGSNPFRLHVLGAPDLRAPDGRRVGSVLSQPKRLGLLTYLALAPEPVTRASLVALFWPESDETRARNALSQAVFYLRRSLDERVVQSVAGDRLWAPREHLWCDARDDTAATGELLHGWNAEDSQELQEWLDAQRRRIRDGSTTPTAPGAPAPTSSAAAPSPPRPPARPRPVLPRATRLATVAALALLAAAVLTLSLVGDRAQGVEAPAAASLAVLLPQIAAAPGAPGLDPAAIHAEILAALPHAATLRIVSATYASSLQDLRRQLAALGVTEVEEPRWILEVNIRVTARAARGVGLLHRSPGYDLPGRLSFDVTYESADAALLEAPKEVAREVAAMVATVLQDELASAPQPNRR
jgi:hypothetical protein